MRVGPPLLYLATAGGLSLTARSLVHPVPLTWSASYLGAYLGLVMLGVAVPGLQMWGEVTSRVPGGRGVALSFDDGPHPEHSRAVSDALLRHEARATFFAIGEKVARRREVARALVEAGHEIGVHGHRIDRWLSLRGLAAVREDLRRATETIAEATGVRPTLFRPPYGLLNPRIVRACEELDLEVIGWTRRGLDGTGLRSARGVIRRVTPALCDGAIICLHDAAERDDRRPAALEAVGPLLEAVAARGLQGVTVSALLSSAPG